MLQNPAELGTYRIARPRERTAVLELMGEHDLYTMQKLAPVLESLAAGYDVLVIDLGQIDFMDSTVLKELVRAEHAVREHDGRFVLSGTLRPVVRKTLEISGMLDHFETTETWEAAIR
jgi:anti-anti-sigma factor